MRSRRLDEWQTFALGFGRHLSVSPRQIASFFERVFNSANTGIEKPNPAAFLQVKAAYPEIVRFVMVGDSLGSDVLGAEAVGIPAILVRNPRGRTRLECRSLLEVANEIERIHA
ncbi:MAG: HAD-IA family hydrolase [Verrucomicrobia bacterium]|nr:HAD-IA family hydrolase [Verrucomicrobiota bacterium]